VDVQTALIDVRFEGNSGHDVEVTRCLLMTHNGPQRRRVLLDYPPAEARKGADGSHLDVQLSLVPRDLPGKVLVGLRVRQTDCAGEAAM